MRTLRFATMTVLASGMLALGAGGWVGLSAAPARAADTYGLVIGINDYAKAGKLDGAIHDAEDLANALKTIGARDIVVLKDHEATRDAVFDHWNGLVAKSKPGDTLVFTYAGHGAQSQERVKGSEADGKDEFLVLSAFDPRGANNRERILDDDIAGMLNAAKGREVLFVADACHSGTMTRAFGSRVPALKTRNAQFGKIEDDALPPPDPAIAAINIAALDNVVSFTAVSDDELDPEVELDGKPRGALSWSIANGLRGGADLDGDRVVSKIELETYVRENVRMAVEGQQHPQVAPQGVRDFSLQLRPTGPAAAPQAVQVASAAALPAPAPIATAPAAKPLPAAGTLSMVIMNARAASPEDLARRLKGVTLVPQGGQADLTWDAGRGEVMNRFGDVIAYRPDGQAGAAEPDSRAFGRSRDQVPTAAADPSADVGRVQKIIDKMAAIDRIKKDSASRPLTIGLKPGDKRHALGDKVTFQVEGHQYTHFVLFNLASDGTVNFLYPLDDGSLKDPLEIPLGRPYSVSLTVEPPFGADHFVAIAAEKPLSGIIADLTALNGKPAAQAVADQLARHLIGQRYQMGVHGVYTGPRS